MDGGKAGVGGVAEQEEEEEEETASEIFPSSWSVSGCRLKRYAASGFSWASFSALLGTTVGACARVTGQFFCGLLFLAVTAPVLMRQSMAAFGKNFTQFLRSLQLYKSGVLTASSDAKLDHGFAVGFGTQSGTDYWMVYCTASGTVYCQVRTFLLRATCIRQSLSWLFHPKGVRKT